ncbi:MAG TPA: GDSL-type esterase/lipase family protein [Nitrososphaerales archaeon]|nr:GDSL-type esterase/lipase family protein [Nitrososphaerales archaeon]
MKRGEEKIIKIVGLGDSTTAGTPGFLSPIESPPNGAGDKESQYSYWLIQGHGDWNVLNRGVNGERSDQILGRFARDVLKEEPAIVVILAGVNDIYQGCPADFTIPNLSKMYSMGLRAGIVPVSCSILPYNTMGNRERLLRRDLNGWIESESRRLRIPFSDTAVAVSAPDNSDKLAGSPDGIHPDVAGYRNMAATIGRTIVEHLSGLR